MELSMYIKNRYSDLSDKEIVDLITKDEHDEEAAVYLLWDRYSPLLHIHYYNLIKLDEFYDYAVESLYMYLRGDDGKWQKFVDFEWRSTLGHWLNRVSWRHFNDVRKKLIEDGIIFVPIDDDDPETPTIQIPDPDTDANRAKVILMEAIAKLKDEDQKFVVLKRLQGYNSKEIALLMQKMWKIRGIERTSQRYLRDENDNYILDKNGNKQLVEGPLIPSNKYVDVIMERAKKELKKIIVTID